MKSKALVSTFVLIVSLFLSHRAAAQPAALAELFCNINCGNCPGQDDPYYTFLSTHQNVILINYHNSTTDNKDLFYLAGLPATQTRDVFYGGNGATQNDPSASIDGVPAGSTESQWATYSTIALGQELPLAISSHIVSGPAGTGIDTIYFTITGSVSKAVNYFVAIKESKIYYANTQAYGNPPGDLWNDVFRSMLPDEASGNGVSFSASGTQTFSVVYDPSNYSYTGNEQNMVAVIFVQDKNATTGNDYQIEGIDTIPLSTASAVSETEAASGDRLVLSSNPLSLNGHLGFDLAKSASVQVSITDMLGRDIRMLVNGEMPSGETSVEMPPSLLQPGCYFARLTVEGHIADIQKFVVAE